MVLCKLSPEDEVSEGPRGADRHRVSAQELALAAAALEQRHADGAQSQAELLSVGEAIRELGLPFSAQELWAEVQARRVESASDRTGPSRLRLWLKSRGRAAGFTLAAAILFSTVAYGVQSGSVAEELARKPVQHITLADVAKYEIVREPTYKSGFPQGIRFCTLAEVPSDVMVIVNANTLSLDNTYVDQNTQNDTPERLPQAAEGAPSVWRIVKEEGRLYVRGWVAYDVSASAARLSGVTIYSTATALGGGHRMLPLTLRATRGMMGNQNMMTYRAVSGEWESIHFDRVRMDEHAREKW